MCRSTLQGNLFLKQSLLGCLLALFHIFSHSNHFYHHHPVRPTTYCCTRAAVNVMNPGLSRRLQAHLKCNTVRTHQPTDHTVTHEFNVMNPGVTKKTTPCLQARLKCSTVWTRQPTGHSVTHECDEDCVVIKHSSPCKQANPLIRGKDGVELVKHHKPAQVFWSEVQSQEIGTLLVKSGSTKRRDASA